jgi:hypothetical protein
MNMVGLTDLETGFNYKLALLGYSELRAVSGSRLLIVDVRKGCR